MRHLHEPLTHPIHPELLHEINNLSIAIKLHHFDLSNETNKEAVEKAKSGVMKPTWENVVDILRKCYNVINEQRENPIKY